MLKGNKFVEKPKCVEVYLDELDVNLSDQQFIKFDISDRLLLSVAFTGMMLEYLTPYIITDERSLNQPNNYHLFQYLINSSQSEEEDILYQFTCPSSLANCRTNNTASSPIEVAQRFESILNERLSRSKLNHISFITLKITTLSSNGLVF